ncbi:hypothetical protein [Ochrobactrum teleogrylli]|uniref:Response regulator n=1 Tax=Ochrobactrum teleogrylli TaxID=2479765 RepID=A0ABD5K0X0_9HYPH
MTRPLTAILADDHAIVRQGLKLLVSVMDGISVIAEANDERPLWSMCAVQGPICSF